MKERSKYRTVVLITDSFPYGAVTEATFVMPEIEALAAKFDRVIVMPTIVQGELIAAEMPDNVEVCTDWLNHLPWRRKLLRAWRVADPQVWRSGVKSYSDLTFAIAACDFASFIEGWISRRGIDLPSTIFEAFWFDIAAGGLAIASHRLPINYIVRAHGHDIYRHCCMTLRSDAVARSIGLFTAGDDGRDYLRAEMPALADKIATARLGSVKLHLEHLTPGHRKASGELTFMSVARVAPEKRVDMNFDMVRQLALARPDLKVKWLHIGDGPLMAELKAHIEATSYPSNLTVDLIGELPNATVQDIYASETIDWTMLLSRGEGLPISVCESLSYGVPVVSTMVRGTQEVVDDDCGLLLAEDPTVEEFVRGIIPYIDSDARMDRLRLEAARRWRREFDAAELRRKFVEQILKLR